MILVLLFLAVSFLVARWLTVENRERGAVVALLREQANGDGAAMLRSLPGCAPEPKCAATVAANARTLGGSGAVKILRYDSGTSFALGSASGQTRVAWDRGGNSDAVVQCVVVERSGLAFLDGSIVLRSISRPIAGVSSCPG